MDKKPFTEESPEIEVETGGEQENPKPEKPGFIGQAIDTLARMGLGEISARVGTNALSVLMVVAVVWLMQSFYQPSALARTPQETAVIQPTSTPLLDIHSIPMDTQAGADAIERQASLHTIIPSRPRIDVEVYTVLPGDSLFGIAEKYGLKPSTILFGNYEILRDTPHSLRPGQILNILPVDGTYYEWQGTENLAKVAEFFGVETETIVEYPGNHLDADALGDYASPNIQPGTWLIVPDGKRQLLSWQAPFISRTEPASTNVLGPGACGTVIGGVVGYGTFVWPTTEHWISGYNWSPETGHYGIDLAGSLGSGIFASDAGVIVYAGWNDWGYGNMIVVDHGNGWQTLYAHLMDLGILVGCGQSVGQGELIGYMGSTGNSSGPHLHFELTNEVYGKVNPLDYLPLP